MAGLVSMNLLGDFVLPAETGIGRKALGLSWIVFVETFAGTMFLWRRPNTSLPTLRLMELALFSLLALIGSLVKFTVLTTPHHLDTDHTNHADLLLRYGGSVTNLPFLFGIILYGVLIPNTRRRSLTVVGILCFVPLAVTGLAAAINPHSRPSLEVVFPMTAMNMFMAGVIAVVSATRTQTLRQEVYQARKEARQVGPYTLKRKLGEGGMGEVYLAEHKLLKRPCAVKFIRPDLAANQSNARRFEREVRAMTTLTHFNTVRIYDYGRTDDGSFYYVMEFLEGSTLDALVRSNGPLDSARAIYFLRQVCGALTEAHTAGLVHRDLKPGNIVIATLGGQHDVAKLLDFGLVQDLGAIDTDARLTQTGTVLGTPAYMSPEQAGGDAVVDARGDIYSLGAVAYFGLTGRPPFEGQSVGKLLAAHLTQTPAFLTEVRKEIPLDLARVVEKCLAKNQAERFQTVAEMDMALANCGCAGDWTSTRAAEWWDEKSKIAAKLNAEASEKPVLPSGDAK
jgi:serine/threonine-protein kinase